MRAVFLGFGFVSAQSQGCFEPAPSPKPRQNPKILAPNGYSISSNALAVDIDDGEGGVIGYLGKAAREFGAPFFGLFVLSEQR
jgi:hypothetical protein